MIRPNLQSVPDALSDVLHGVEPQRRTAIAEDAIASQRRQWKREHRRPPALSAREALAALRFEATVLLLVAHDVRAGKQPPADDWDRFLLAIARISAIAEEVIG